MNPMILEVLLRAQEAEVGLRLKTSDVALAKAQLYKGLKFLGIKNMSILTPPVGADDTLWLVKKGEQDGSS